mmetsp:Transcript_120561/g.212705  ORF Transcript_120561/g.212705 Transcript_120561/m.212705 type:complete len:449 (-) Transcript_120561:111-1457(-)
MMSTPVKEHDNSDDGYGGSGCWHFSFLSSGYSCCATQEFEKIDDKSVCSTREGSASSLAFVGQSSDSSIGSKSVSWTNNFHKRYSLGDEVAPSGSSDTKVHFAIRNSDEERVVIKLRFKPKEQTKSSQDDQVWREIHEELMNISGNVGILNLHEVLEDDRAFYIVMERVDGLDLSDMMNQEHVSVAATQNIVRQLLGGLAHLHNHNLVHKDLKLENIMVEYREAQNDDNNIKHMDSRKTLSQQLHNGDVKIIDFDTVERWSPGTGPAKRGTSIVGTDQYIAQEAYAGKYSPSSDIFAAGVIAYALLTKKFPFPDKIFDDQAGENWAGSRKMEQVRLRLKNTKVSFAHRVFREQPRAKALVKQMLSHNEDQRPTAAAALKHPWLQENPSENDEVEEADSPTTGRTDDTQKSLASWDAPAPPHNTPASAATESFIGYTCSTYNGKTLVSL